MSESVSLVAVDFESYYDAEYSLSKMSTFNYCHDPRFDAYLVAIHDKTGPVFIGHPGKFDWGYLKGKTVLAHNAAFDYQVYLRLVETGVIKNPPETEPWLCTADLAAYLGCKRDLATACRFLLGVEVSKAVRTAMRGRKGAELAEDPEVLKYGGRDAELCYMLAEAKLAEWPADERELSILNREACLSGVAVDLKKVETGRDVLKRRAEGLLEQIPWVATGHKPLSPNALKDYARACGIPAPASTAKTNPEFQDWVEKHGGDRPWVKVVGEYRSVNILQKRVESLYAGVDRQTGKFPYSIKYAGANTARFCIPGSAEVLTETGWRQLQHWNGSKIMQWDPSGILKFAEATPNAFDNAGATLVQMSGHGVKLPMTPEHRVPHYTSRKSFRVATAAELRGKRIDVPTAGIFSGGVRGLTAPQIQLLVAAQADGNWYECASDAAWSFGFKKERKFLRLIRILDRLGVQYRTRVSGDTLYNVHIQKLDAPWYLTKTFSLGLLLECTAESLEVFMGELAHWDGHNDNAGGAVYSTVSENNAKTVQTIAHITGRRCSITPIDRSAEHPEWQLAYRLYITAKREYQLSRVTEWQCVKHNKKVYCPTTETGFFLCRYDGGIFITGNSGGGDTGGKFNMQNMPRNEMFGVDLRPMFVASPGNKLVICDYAQVEARYLLWLVGDEAALAPLREGGNLYQTLAERMGLTTPGSDIKSTDKALYRYTKAFGLGAGYFMSGGKFKGVSKTQMGLDMTDEEAKAAIRKYREANPKQVAYWYEHQDALALSARRRDPAHQVELKSGRVLTYTDPRHAWRIDPATQRRRKEIQVTQVLGLNRTWMHGGILTENEVQASCRDLLKDAWLACARAGYRPILSVHDELVFDLPKEKVAEAVPVIERLMTQSSPWAEGLPLAVETVVSDTYTK